MNFHWNLSGAVDTLYVMLMGMLGGMIVMGVICLILMALYRFGKRGRKNGA